MQKERILIIGINSFLGKAIFNYTKEEYEISAVYHSNKTNIPGGIEVVQADNITQLKGCEFKYIFLVSSHVPVNNRDIEDQPLIDANIHLPKIVCGLFPSSKVIFFSSVSIYENYTTGKTISVTETMPAPQSRYALSKLWGEQIIASHYSYVILRISSMYGIGMKLTTFIPRVIKSACSLGEITILGNGERLQNYIHVDDVAQIALRAAESDENLILHGVADQSYSNKEIAEKIAAIIPCHVTYTGEDSTPSYIYDNNHTTIKLGPYNYKNIDEGLKELIEWTKEKF